MCACPVSHWKILFLAAVLAACSMGVGAQSVRPPEIAARSYLLLDVTAGQVLAAKDVNAAVEPASLTKLMTAYLVFDALRAKRLELKQTVEVSERAWKMPGSRMFIGLRMQVPVEDLIRGMIVQSGNDATIALAEAVAGNVERFVELMNEQALALGMRSTHYKNPEGLAQAGHSTTARDLGVLATHLLQDFPQYTGVYAIKNYRYAGAPAANDTNRNLLLFRDPSVDGLKTGHTDAAGYCIVATAQRLFPNLGVGKSPGNRRLLAIVLGTASENARADEAQKLLNWGYTAFEAIKLFEPDQAVTTAPVWKGKVNYVKLGKTRAIIAAVPVGSASKIVTHVARPDPLIAPLTKGQSLGSLEVTLGAQTQPLARIPLEVLEPVDQAGLLGRAWDALRLWIR